MLIKLFGAVLSDGATIIGRWREKKIKIDLAVMAALPSFIRFNEVKIWHRTGFLAFEEKCEFIESQLLQFKTFLNDSNMIKFYAIIEQNDHRHFSDHSLLLQYIHNRLIPICNASRGYKFDIGFYSDEYSVRNVIESLLQSTEIKHCTNVDIVFETHRRWGVQGILPVEAISSWLGRSADGKENIMQAEKEKLLKIGFYSFHVQNALEMVDHLKMV